MSMLEPLFVGCAFLFCFAGFYSKLVSRTLKKYKTGLQLLDSNFLVLNKHRISYVKSYSLKMNQY